MDWIKRLFRRKQKQAASMMQPPISAAQMDRMLGMMGKTQDVELSCDEVHALLAEYTELALRGEDIAAALPLVFHHLQMCPGCYEEYEALTRILEAMEE